MADLKCQYPIVIGVAPHCTNKARWHDRYGWTFCDEHKTDGDVLLGTERPTKDALDTPSAMSKDGTSAQNGVPVI